MTPASRALTVALLLAVPACRKEAGQSNAPASASRSDASASGSADESITNTQVQGVDEGGIIKTHGDHLVVLRRGRLFTIDLGADRLKPLSFVDVPPRSGHDAWYDEMIVHGDTIVVIGYSYRFSATEIGMFAIDGAGNLSHTDTWFLRSNDYYSSRNYASRLVGDQLVFYMPHAIDRSSDDDTGPGLQRWHRGMRRGGDWDRVVDRDEIVPPITPDADTLHTLVTCDLSGKGIGCTGRGILGRWGRTFFVSGTAVYVWTGGVGYIEDRSDAALYRLPLRGGDVGALRVKAAPVDQFSFTEGADGRLHVVLRTEAIGDGMWAPEVSSGDLGLLSLGKDAFAKFGANVPASAYQDLPDPMSGSTYAFQNRWVDDVLLYGNGAGWGYTEETARNQVFVHELDGDTETIEISHGVDRLEPLGDNGLVVGTDRSSANTDLHFTSLALDGGAHVGGHFVQPGAAQGETRSHGFFFKPSGETSGMLGLPTRAGGEPGYRHLFEGSLGVLFLDVEDLQFRRLGSLVSDPNAARDDACNTSCVDWYGNARPVFYKGRIFALLGYELVEGRIADGRMTEVARVDMLDVVRGHVVRIPG